jgi:predicted nucleic acid-binding protein
VRVYLWVDANVVLRFLTGDPPEMAAKAMELMSRAEKGAIGLRVSHLVVAEIVWVLSSFYKYAKNVDFADAYLAALARAQEESICSFDNDFEKLNVKWVTPPGDR